MRFSPQFLDELRARLPVSDVVGRRVKLRKAGREWKGLSPFNKEKTPSFFVNDQKMAWFDFSSGKNGNIFDFVMATEGLSFPEAVERLAQQAGMPLPVVSQDEEARDQPPQDAQRRRRAGGEILSGDAGRRAPAPRRAAISPTAASIRRRSSNSAWAMRRPSASRSRSISASKGIPVEDMVEAGHAGRRRRHPGALRSLPRPRDVSDRRSARARHRLRRPRARKGRAGEIPQFAGDAALPQGRERSTTSPPPRSPRTRARRR